MDILEQFWSHVDRHPKSIAIKDDSVTYSYEKFGRRIANLSSQISTLRQSGSRPVAILSDHDADLVTSMMAVYNAGFAFQPLDPSFPDDRLRRLIASTQPRAIFVSKKYESRIKQILTESVSTIILAIDPEERGVSDGVMAPINAAIDPSSPGYILSTSGSTGEPKCVLHSRATLERSVSHYCSDLGVNAVDNVALVLPCTYTPSLFSIFGALSSGASLRLFDLKKYSIEQMAQWLEDSKISLLYSSPTIFRRLINQFSGSISFDSIRSIQLAGEVLFKADVDAYQQRFANKFTLYNGMGTTETSCLTRFCIDSTTEIQQSRVPIGKPYDDIQISVLSSDGQPVEQGVEGELCVTGEYIAHGYVGDTDKSKQSFSLDDNSPALVRYRTGDRVTLTESGDLIHLGRIDSQVKLRGQRVELAEIEAVMLRSGFAAEAAVLLIEGEEAQGKDPFLAAFFTPKGDVSVMRQFLSSQLPPYMIPTRIVSLGSLPTNASGKLDRIALGNFNFEMECSEEPSAPENVVELRILECFRDVLQDETLHINSHFFDNGGDSLKAVELAIALQQHLAVPVNVSTFIESPTPKKMAQEVYRILRAGKDKHLVRFYDEEFSSHGDDPNKEEKTPIFCIPGLVGNALSFRALATEMLSVRPVYAIEYPGYNGEEITYKSMSELVDLCVDSIISTYPSGPIALVCYSAGGTVGFHVREKLSQIGRDVVMLAMLDCYAPAGIKVRHIRDTLKYRLKSAINSFTKNTPSENIDVMNERNARADNALTSAIFNSTAKPQNIENMVLVVARDQTKPFGFYDNYREWRKLVPNGFKTISVSGGHLSLIRPEKAKEMADLINKQFSSKCVSNDSGAGPIVRSSLNEAWCFQDAKELKLSEIDAKGSGGFQEAILSRSEQLTQQIEGVVEAPVRPEVITSQQTGRFYYRKVALREAIKNTTVVVAAIRVAMDAVGPSAASDIIEAKTAFGTILKKRKIPYRCNRGKLFKVEVDEYLAKIFHLTESVRFLYGRSNQFVSSDGGLIADVFEILSPDVRPRRT